MILVDTSVWIEILKDLFFFIATKTLSAYPVYAHCNRNALIGVDSQLVI